MPITTKISSNRDSVTHGTPLGRWAGLWLCAGLALAGCAPAPTADEINDPYEAQNRKNHEFNVTFDKLVLRPAGEVYVAAVPQPVAIGIAQFADNLSLPTYVANDVLQLRLDYAVQNTLRFAINSTVGLLGVLDPASKIGLPAQVTDFGATMHRWGVPEGAYVEAAFFGPTTERDIFGRTVDFVLDPLRLFIPDSLRWAQYIALGATAAGDRGRYSETVDSILYDSADSYAQMRLFYLQNRRYELGDTTATDEATFEDPYAQ